MKMRTILIFIGRLPGRAARETIARMSFTARTPPFSPPFTESCPFFWVDAFTSRTHSGNPCAVLHVDAFASDDALLATAREMGLSETAYVRSATSEEDGSAEFDFEARYFTPEREIPLAGHPTLATVRSLIDAGRIGSGAASIRLKLPAGIVRVAIAWVDDGARATTITMEQRRPEFFERLDAREIAPAIGLAPADLLPGHSAQIVSTGNRGLLVPVADHAALRRAALDPGAIGRLGERYGFFGVHLFCVTGATPRGRTFARHPAAGVHSPEDPFTGSATGAMGAYLWRNSLIDSPRFLAEQGHWMGRPGEAEVEVVGPRDAIETVRVGGEAITLVRGEFRLA